MYNFSATHRLYLTFSDTSYSSYDRCRPNMLTHHIFYLKNEMISKLILRAVAINSAIQICLNQSFFAKIFFLRNLSDFLSEPFQHVATMLKETSPGRQCSAVERDVH